MKNEFSDGADRLPLSIYIWFAINFILALAPGIHMFVNDHPGDLFGLPGSIVYFLGVGVSITASVVAAYFAESVKFGNA
jgi:hypothetical protein